MASCIQVFVNIPITGLTFCSPSRHLTSNAHVSVCVSMCCVATCPHLNCPLREMGSVTLTPVWVRRAHLSLTCCSSAKKGFLKKKRKVDWLRFFHAWLADGLTCFCLKTAGLTFTCKLYRMGNGSICLFSGNLASAEARTSE